MKPHLDKKQGQIVNKTALRVEINADKTDNKTDKRKYIMRSRNERKNDRERENTTI